MRPDALGQVADADAPETTQCAVCRGTAEHLSSAWQGEGTAYHNYQCRTERCPAAGMIIEHKSGEFRRVGPIFGSRDLAVRLATREHPDAPAECQEVGV
ncbi:hypothetical protein MUK72_19475 (plasmid) [Halococcus dombrowskii]|uniref:Uncharacterized protein n=1 Tax=Halococcus dombrowskii TaxID=179637 RepID=A0AAV3SIF5_HALDO|nr:hypothetical protein [Halococcus dombrowskii]UOO97331.1 hypothetical protein MUK72_19475 [Halococcus dombrowskii]